MIKLSRFSLLAVMVFALLCIIRPVYALIPVVKDVVVYSSNGNTFLNITVNHLNQTTLHYVDTIRVTIGGSNTTDLPVSFQPATPDNNYTYPYNAGPISGTQMAVVAAHCNLHGWSEVIWSGPIPEFSFPVLLLAFAASSSVIVFGYPKSRR